MGRNNLKNPILLWAFPTFRELKIASFLLRYFLDI
jgi:hypothetical protein